MAVRTHVETIISCDGVEGRCNTSAQLHSVLPATASINRAKKLGWSIEDEVRCPSCQETPQTAAITVVQTHYPWPTQLPGAAEAPARDSRPAVRHLRLA